MHTPQDTADMSLLHQWHNSHHHTAVLYRRVEDIDGQMDMADNFVRCLINILGDKILQKQLCRIKK